MNVWWKNVIFIHTGGVGGWLKKVISTIFNRMEGGGVQGGGGRWKIRVGGRVFNPPPPIRQRYIEFIKIQCRRYSKSSRFFNTFVAMDNETLFLSKCAVCYYLELKFREGGIYPPLAL